MAVQIFFSGKKSHKYFTCSDEDAEFARSKRWYTNMYGYVIDSGGQQFHTQVLGSAAEKGLVWDHIDGDKWNNCRDNLRMYTNSQNMLDVVKSNNRSGVTGVHYSKHHGRWRAHISINKKFIHLGWFRSFENAVAARTKAVKEVENA